MSTTLPRVESKLDENSPYIETGFETLSISHSSKTKLTAQNKLAPVGMCNWFNNKLEEDEDWINNFWFSDEAHFHLDDYANSKNCVFWGTELPQEVLQQLYTVQRSQLCMQ